MTQGPEPCQGAICKAWTARCTRMGPVAQRSKTLGCLQHFLAMTKSPNWLPVSSTSWWDSRNLGHRKACQGKKQVKPNSRRVFWNSQFWGLAALISSVSETGHSLAAGGVDRNHWAQGAPPAIKRVAAVELEPCDRALAGSSLGHSIARAPSQVY